MSPQALLAAGIAIPLLAMAGYLAWLARRVRRLERRVGEPDPRDSGDEPDRG